MKPASSDSHLRSVSFRWIELLVLFVASPCLLISGAVELSLRWIVFLFTITYVALVIGFTRPTRRQMGLARPPLRIVLTWATVYLALAAATWSVWYLGFHPDQTFALSIAAVTIAYPLVSAPAQELLFRSFYFYRYNGLVGRHSLTVLNIVLFVLYHAIFGRWVSVGLSAVAGCALTLLYRKTSNFTFVWVLHAFLGILVFGAGIGDHFTDLFG